VKTIYLIAARLDGTNRLMQKRKTASMAEFLQLDDWEPPTSGADGKKRVSFTHNNNLYRF